MAALRVGTGTTSLGRLPAHEECRGPQILLTEERDLGRLCIEMAGAEVLGVGRTAFHAPYPDDGRLQGETIFRPASEHMRAHDALRTMTAPQQGLGLGCSNNALASRPVNACRHVTTRMRQPALLHFRRERTSV